MEENGQGKAMQSQGQWRWSFKTGKTLTGPNHLAVFNHSFGLSEGIACIEKDAFQHSVY